MDSDDSEKIIHDNFIRFGKMITKGSILIEGVISTVDEVKFTCDVTIQSTNPDGSDTNTIINNVPIKVLQGTQASFIEIPEVGSNCTLCFRDNNIQRPQLYQVDQCDKILIKISNQILQIDSNGFVFNDGTIGMVKADVLKTESEKDKAILDALLQILTGAPIKEPGNNAPSALQTQLKIALTGKQSGTWTQLQDTNIKH